MAGGLALRAEVLGRLDDPRPEDLEPEPVDRHARRQRVVRLDQPSGQSQPVERRAGRQRRQECRNAPAHLLAPLVVLASLEQECRFGLAGLLAEDQRRGELRLDRLPLLLGLRQLRSQRRRDLLRLAVGVLDEVFAQLLELGLGPPRSIAQDDRAEVLRQPRGAGAAMGHGPGGERVVELAVLGDHGRDAGVVPVDRSAVLGERPAVDDRPGRELEAGGRHLQPHPLAGGRQDAHPQPLGRAILAPVDRVLSPVCRDATSPPPYATGASPLWEACSYR